MTYAEQLGFDPAVRVPSQIDWISVCFVTLLLSVPEEMQSAPRTIAASVVIGLGVAMLIIPALRTACCACATTEEALEVTRARAVIASVSNPFLHGSLLYCLFGDVISAWMLLPLTLQRANYTHAE